MILEVQGSGLHLCFLGNWNGKLAMGDGDMLTAFDPTCHRSAGIAWVTQGLHITR